ncbi:MAG: hypothetical protein GY913_08515 [Proteobacteria bacterium]|nr:hypothetical protein [Pseudomonadota bacterium]MCP4916953.1 hypothetical protein [Pseudomonadota bacterium]
MKSVGAGTLFALLCTLVIALTAGGLTSFELVGPTVPFAYPWRLVEPTQGARLSAWLGYAAHNLAAWGVIAWARRAGAGWGGRFRAFNWVMLAVHVVFVGLHVLQSRVYYDGLAQDVPELTALGSVALMLMVVLVLEAPRRGLAFGRGKAFHKRFLTIVREYHGYLFTWALIYTFWYHPTEGTWGHLAGFFYMFVLLWQSVLLFDRAHRNRWWTLALELLVIPHAVFVAVHQGHGLWPMFLFGFGAVFAMTQLYGLGLSDWLRRAVLAVFVLGMVATYVATGRLTEMHEVTRIPVLDYGIVGLAYGLFLVVNRVLERVGLLQRV